MTTSWVKRMTVSVSLLISITTDVWAGTLTPYEVVTIGYNTNRNVTQLLSIDLESGVRTVIPGVPQRSDVIAIDSDGSIFVPHDGPPMIIEEGPVPTVELARFDFSSQKWDVAVLVGALDHNESDIEIEPDGNPIDATEISMVELDLAAKRTRSPEGLNNVPAGIFGKLDIDSTGAIVYTAIGRFSDNGDRTMGLLRYREGADKPEQIEKTPDLWVNEFALESNDAIIALGTFNIEDAPQESVALYRIDLQSGTSEVVFQSAELPRFGRVAVDPAGRVLVSNNQPSPQILRIDLSAGTQESFFLPNDFEIRDMKVRGIP